MFDEEPDGDPHGECAAEIHRLQDALKAAEVERDALRRDVVALRGFSELWYFVMDEKPLEFESIVASYPSARWMDEAAKLRKAHHG